MSANDPKRTFLNQRLTMYKFIAISIISLCPLSACAESINISTTKVKVFETEKTYVLEVDASSFESLESFVPEHKTRL